MGRCRVNWLVGLVIFEIFAAALVFCGHMGHASWRRAWPVVAAYAACFMAGSFGIYWTAGDILASTVFYVTVFLVVTVSVGQMFSLSAVASLVVGTLGYCAQHLASDISSLFLRRILESGGNYLLFSLANSLVLAGCYAVIWRFIGRRFKVDEAVVSRRARWVAACALTVLFLIVFRLLFPEAQEGWLRPVLFFYDALVTLFLMLTLVLISRVDGLRAGIASQEAIWRGKREQYELARDNMDLINIKCHDIRKRIGAMGESPLSEESVGRIRESIRIYDAQAKTGNEALDVVLTQKRLLCSQTQVDLVSMVDGAALGFMSDDDVYFLFGNILDNAIEAVLNLADDEKRSIDLTVRREGGFVTIREDNYFEGSLSFVDGLPQTTKGDSVNHGFGMRSIRRCVDEYGGRLTVRADAGVFSLSILLPSAAPDAASMEHS